MPNRMKRILLLLCLSASFSCSQVKVDFLGPLQGENGGKGSFPYQGMDISGDYMLSCQNQGAASVYRLSGDSLELAGQFHLASFHKDNHSNVVTFGLEKAQEGDPLPVAYISQCSRNSIDGKKDVLYAERIAPDFSSSELLQTIFYDDVNRDFGYALQWVIDQEEKVLYGYGNTISNSDPDNRHRVIKFRLPSLSEGPFVTLKPEEALENYLIEEKSGFRFNPIGQGLYVHKGKLYMPTGTGRAEYPSVLYIWDLKKYAMTALDLSGVTTSEFEDISRRGDAFYIQAQDGIFKLKLGPRAARAGFDWHAFLPRPVYDADPQYVERYNKAWELAYRQIDMLSGVPSSVRDAAFMGRCCKYCPSVFPGLRPLDSLYAALPADGSRAALPEDWALTAGTEYKYALQTGSKAHLKKVFTKEQYLQRLFAMSEPSDSSASLFALYMSRIATLLKKPEEAAYWKSKQEDYVLAREAENALPGWEPIPAVMEDVVGIKEANAFEKTLLCDFPGHPKGRTGVMNYRFGEVVCDVIATEKTIEVTSNRPFTLSADGRSFDVNAGKNSFVRE